MRPARADIIVCTGLATRGGVQIWNWEPAFQRDLTAGNTACPECSSGYGKGTMNALILKDPAAKTPTGASGAGSSRTARAAASATATTW